MKKSNTQSNETPRRSGMMCALAGLGLLVAAALPAIAGKGNAGNPGLLPPQSNPHGASYGEWAARWWQWSMAFPSNASPNLDTADPSAGQSGHVWFVAGSPRTATVRRHLVVPAGTALFVPILTAWADNSGCPTFTDLSEEELRAVVADSWSAVSRTSCEIDGRPVQGLTDPQTTPYLVQTPVFSYTVAQEHNVLAEVYGEPCIAGGTTVDGAVAQGAFLMLAPLSVGKHTLHFAATVGPVASPFLTRDITYDITVTPHNDQ